LLIRILDVLTENLLRDPCSRIRKIIGTKMRGPKNSHLSELQKKQIDPVGFPLTFGKKQIQMARFLVLSSQRL